MDRIDVPETLDELNVDQLKELKATIKESAEALAEDAARDDDALREIERLGQEYDRITAELAARAAAESERAARAEEALGRFADPEAEAEVEAEVTAEPEAAATEPTAEEPAVEADPLAVAVASTEAVATAVTEEPAVAAVAAPVVAAVDEPAEEAVPEAPAAPAVPEVPEAPASEPEIVEAAIEEPPTPVQATTTTEEAPVSADNTIREEVAVAALERSRPDGLAPADTGRTAGFQTMRATNSAAGVNEGEELSSKTLAEAITRKVHGMSNIPTGTYERIVVGTMVADYGDKRLSSGPEENFSVISGLRKEATALVAAGGNCAPLAPSYDFFRLAEALNPVEMCLPAVEAPRGGIRFITPPDFRDAAGGVRVTTEAEDAAGYPPTAPKPCVRVDCPPIEECRVDAVSECVTFGNLNYRVFPEQVEAFLEDLNVMFVEKKEIFYLDAINAASTAVTSNGPYGASRSLVWDLLQEAAGYRRRNHMAPNATLQLMLPSWVLELVELDMINDHALGLSFLGNNAVAQFEAFLSDNNLSVCYYYDSATGAGQAFNGVQAAGPLNRFPGTVVSYLYAPGTFVRLDAGTLDLGIVRDSVLNGTNDLQIFSEQWIQVCMVGLESIRLTSTLCPDGTAPEPVPPVICP